MRHIFRLGGLGRKGIEGTISATPGRPEGEVVSSV
jgi:hypothetical protein